MTLKLFLGVFIFMLGQIGGWYQLNSQYVWKWWQDKPLMSAVVFGMPTSIAFWYAWRMVIGSGTGFLVFPLLTWIYLGESMFTVKTILCLVLAVAIILIQIYG